MFERVACTDHAQLTAAPFIDITALTAAARSIPLIMQAAAAARNSSAGLRRLDAH